VKKFVILSAALVAASAGSALAQNFRLDLFLTYRSVSGAAGAETLTDVQTGGSVNAVAGQTYRVELRYRIADLTADTTGSRGLSAASIGFTQTGGGTASGHRRSNLSNDQASASSPAASPDASGLLPDGDMTTGLIGEFRGGLTGDTAPANGTPAASGWSILPLALSAPAASTSWGSGNPTAANTDANQARFGVYAFEFVYGGGNVTFTASAIADPQTGNRFGGFRRTGSTNDPVPQTSTLATDGTISFVPAPASAALLGLGGLVAARRRRA
jgi:hypothetical protein